MSDVLELKDGILGIDPTAVKAALIDSRAKIRSALTSLEATIPVLKPSEARTMLSDCRRDLKEIEEILYHLYEGVCGEPSVESTDENR